MLSEGQVAAEINKALYLRITAYLTHKNYSFNGTLSSLELHNKKQMMYFRFQLQSVFTKDNNNIYFTLLMPRYLRRCEKMVETNLVKILNGCSYM